MSSADVERTIVSHYNLTSAYPTEWPAELDDSDEEAVGRAGMRRSKSRYSALERVTSDRRTLLPGSQRTQDGKANLVQKDESDPLDGSGSVISSLRNRGLPVEQDLRLRNKFLLSSTTFSPALFLSQAHSDASTDDLLQGLQTLSRSIDQKAQSLKVLVETNFERFVRAKATIDNVYSEMRNQGVQAAPSSPGQPMRNSRQVSRNSAIHARNFSSGSAAGMAQPSLTPSKNALRKETEYGVQGIKVPLLEVSQRAEDVWGPALGGKEREASLKGIVDAVERDRPLYELGGELSTAIQQKNYDRVVQLYSSARNYATQAVALGDKAAREGMSLTDDEVHKLLVTGRMWTDVEEQTKSFRRDVWRRLTNAKTIAPGSAVTQSEHHMELIGILLEMGVEDNPIWVWLLSRYDTLKSKIAAVVDRSKIEIEIMRRRIAATAAPSVETSALHLRQACARG
jgi:exocyst complex component 2